MPGFSKTNTMNKQRLTILIVAILGVIGTFLPWISTPFGSVKGTEGDGYITLALYAVVLVFSVLGKTKEPLKGGLLIGAIIIALVASAVGLYDIMNAKKLLGSMKFIGIGLYLVSVAGILIAILSFVIKDKKAEV